MKTIVITGASSGVGQATARELARRGHRVVLNARRADLIEALAGEIGDAALPCACDAADADAVDAMATDVLSRWGPPDVIVNCAGAGQWKPLADTTPEDAQGMMDAPYFAAVNTTRAFLPAMLDRGRGVVIHVNSPACFAPWPGSVGYAAARWALRGLHEALWQDLRGTGVHSCHVVFAKVASGYFDANPGVEAQMPRLSRWMPTLTPEDCARHVVSVIHRPRHTAVFPTLLRVMLVAGRPFPPVMRWFARL